MLCSLINIKKIVFVVYNRNLFNFQKWFLHDIFNFKINKKINVNSIWRNRNNQMPIISIQNSLHLKRFHILSPILCSRLKNKLYFVNFIFNLKVCEYFFHRNLFDKQSYNLYWTKNIYRSSFNSQLPMTTRLNGYTQRTVVQKIVLLHSICWEKVTCSEKINEKIMLATYVYAEAHTNWNFVENARFIANNTYF